MTWFKSLKGDHPDHVGSPSSQREEVYAPPPGPPPSGRQNDQYAPPLGPPPSHIEHGEHAPPIWPPPSKSASEEYAPPPGPPPSHQTDDEPPPYHDWTSIPDTALLPPPPAIGHDYSPSGNAEEAEAIRAHRWCDQYPLIKPHQPSGAQTHATNTGEVMLQKPREYNGSLSGIGRGLWKGSARGKDACLLTSLPLYFVMTDSPSNTRRPKTIYFEVKIRALGQLRAEDSSSLAIGFCAVPYPTWRMPGWERGSLAIHSDDGRRYVNNTEGGQDFTTPVKVGETVGIGITFSPPDHHGLPVNGEVFFTRNGSIDGSWNVHEEFDDSRTDFGALGVDGQYDLFGAIGTFGDVKFEARFNSQDWLWRPS